MINMWPKRRISTKTSDHKKQTQRHVSINSEYLRAFRTQSYVEFFTKAQFLVTDPPSSSTKAAKILLEPDQDSIHSLLNALSSKSGLKILLLSYFDTSAEASRICTELLCSIIAGRGTYRFIRTSLETFSTSCPNELSSIISELSSFTNFTNPFSTPTHKDFKLIHSQYISILHHLKSKRKQLIRRRKLVGYSKKAAGLCLKVGFAALAWIMGAFTGDLRKKWRNMRNMRWFRNRAFRRAGEQIDAAAKGTYILDRDFDTMSRLVEGLRDEVERIKGLIRFWVKREDKLSLQEVVKELRRSEKGLKKQVEELEEHVCLCLVTINKVRVSVIEQI